jgi:hypothetical protein
MPHPGLFTGLWGVTGVVLISISLEKSVRCVENTPGCELINKQLPDRICDGRESRQSLRGNRLTLEERRLQWVDRTQRVTRNVKVLDADGSMFEMPDMSEEEEAVSEEGSGFESLEEGKTQEEVIPGLWPMSLR